MNPATQRVLDHLGELGFETRAGVAQPFGEELPLVSGVAWDTKTAQLAFVAEFTRDDEIEAWRQLLFAGSGLRHQLVGDGPAAFGTPVILAIVDDDGERALRALAEDLVQRYALFKRVDLNLVRREDLDDDRALDLALAPLLPCCRTLLGQEISKGEVQRFWRVLRAEVEQVAAGLDDVFGAFRKEAGVACAEQLIGDSADAPQLPAPEPITALELNNFRSFDHARVELAPVSVVHGPNGSGKSSILEGLELVWAGRSQRQPDDVDAAEYGRHLARDGTGDFVLRGDGRTVGAVAASARAELPRCVLTQESVAALVAAAPAQRYAGLLSATGLEIPDLKQRTQELVTTAKREADVALRAAGIPPLPRIDSVGLRHLRSCLASGFLGQLPASVELDVLEDRLAEAAGSAYERRSWDDESAASVVANADAVLSSMLTDPEQTVPVAEALDAAQEVVAQLATERHEAARAARMLLDALSVPDEASGPVAKAQGGPASPPRIPAVVATRWLSHSHGLRQAAERFRGDAEDLDDEQWTERLAQYADALEAAARQTPRVELEALARAAPVTAASRRTSSVDPVVLRAAGLSTAPESVDLVVPPLRELATALQRHADALDAIVAALTQHPGRHLGEHAHRVLRSLCRFEVARVLRREGPIVRASEALIRELLRGRLAPALRELVAAIVRFELYFKPLQVPDGNRTLILGGLATAQADLDARLVLNAAERNVVGVAWFLALHLLQPAERRRVLVLDDPASAFDAVNEAGLIATLRAFVRLTRPEQVIVATHDDALAAVLAEALARSTAGRPRRCGCGAAECRRREHDERRVGQHVVVRHGGGSRAPRPPR